jgi:glycosyltransferase involved in cell wall biosynthesis
MPNVVLLIVGGGKMCDNIKRKAKRLGIDKVVITPGPVRNESVHWYFAATDVGLYPGSDLPYYRAASPLKIVEYSAARAQVVSSPVQFFMQGWPNVHITKPAAAEFADAIAKALRGPKLAPDLSQFDWPSLAHEFDECIWDVDGKVQSVTPTT